MDNFGNFLVYSLLMMALPFIAYWLGVQEGEKNERLRLKESLSCTKEKLMRQKAYRQEDYETLISIDKNLEFIDNIKL